MLAGQPIGGIMCILFGMFVFGPYKELEGLKLEELKTPTFWYGIGIYYLIILIVVLIFPPGQKYLTFIFIAMWLPFLPDMLTMEIRDFKKNIGS